MSAAAPRLPAPKLWLFRLVILLLPFVVLELALRGWLAFRVGPDLLLYGTPFARGAYAFDRSAKERAELDRFREQRDLIDHDNFVGGHFKYFPGQERHDFDEKGERFDVVMNDHGFRGKDFEDAKALGTFRVVTLGASSTFGYMDRDDETYPYQLERLLNEGLARSPCGEVRAFEVLNLGIPHLRSENVLSLLEAEALPLRPDVVTFYEGVNDAVRTSSGKDAVISLGKRSPRLRATFLWLRERLIAFNLLDNLISNRPRQHTAADLEAQAAAKTPPFVENLRKMSAACRERGVTFVLVSQQSKSMAVPREEIRGLTYAAEVALLERKLASGPIGPKELHFLLHDRLMRAERELAAGEGIPFVDAVAAMDEERDALVSWVHVDARGNALIAGAIGAKVREIACGAGAAAAPERLVPSPP